VALDLGVPDRRNTLCLYTICRRCVEDLSIDRIATGSISIRRRPELNYQCNGHRAIAGRSASPCATVMARVARSGIEQPRVDTRDARLAIKDRLTGLYHRLRTMRGRV
jgi:hypothetical protein